MVGYPRMNNPFHICHPITTSLLIINHIEKHLHLLRRETRKGCTPTFGRPKTPAPTALAQAPLHRLMMYLSQQVFQWQQW